MNTLNFFPIKLYEFRNNNADLLSNVLEDVKKADFKDNMLNQISNLYYHEELFSWFEECLSEVVKIHFNNKNLAIIDSWANKTVKLGKHHKHSHPNSIISAIFYLTSHEDGYTVFETEDPWRSRLANIFLTDDSSGLKIGTNLQEKIKPEAGKLILFPSTLEHLTSPLIKNTERYTISFNTFFSGIISSQNSIKLEVKPKSAKERYLENKI